MSPCQQAIQVSDFRVQFVVSLRANGDNAVRADRPDVRRHLENASVRDFLAVSDIHEREFLLCGGVDEHGGNDERAKIIALAGLIDSDAFDRRCVCCLVGHRQDALLVESIRSVRCGNLTEAQSGSVNFVGVMTEPNRVTRDACDAVMEVEFMVEVSWHTVRHGTDVLAWDAKPILTPADHSC